VDALLVWSTAKTANEAITIKQIAMEAPLSNRTIGAITPVD
jgi:hypothetical protein